MIFSHYVKITVLDIGYGPPRATRGIFDALEHTEGFKGVTGTISFSLQNHVPSKTAWVIAVENGERSLARAFVPASVPPPMLENP